MNTTSMNTRRYNIFISSTFRDMDFERDLIKYKVIPLLNSYFRDRFVEIQAIDLRLGVNTEKMGEEESAKKVLNVCASSIDNARPFFIGLIGARYGWIPPIERWNEFIRRLPENEQTLMRDTFGKSVTELEIVYGGLTPKSLQESHTLFFMRDEASYKGIPDHMLPIFYDDNPQQQKQLKNLKNRIIKDISELGGYDDKIISYHIDWDEESNGFNETDEKFSILVMEHLKVQIESELEAEARVKWWEKEKTIAENTLDKHLRDLCTSIPHYDIIMEQQLICGLPCDGRSTLLAWQWYRRRTETDDICLVACIGKTPYSSAMYYIIARWCEELGLALGVESNGSAYMDEGKPLVSLCDEFYRLIDIAFKKGVQVSIFIDDVDMFKHTNPADMYLSCLDSRVNLIATCNLEESDKILMYHSYCDTITTGFITGKPLEELIKINEQRFHIELPSKIRTDILSHKHIAGSLTTIFRMIAVTNGASLDNLRKEDGNFYHNFADAFLDYFSSGFKTSRLPRDLAQHVCGMIGLDWHWYQLMLGFLSKCPWGLRTFDLETLAGDDWDLLEWTQLTYYLQDYIDIDSNGLWRTNFSDFGAEYEEDIIDTDLNNYAERLPEGDWIRDRIMNVPIIKPYTHFYELDVVATDRIIENFFGSEKEQTSVREDLIKLKDDSNYNTFNPVDTGGLNKNPFATITEQSVMLRNDGRIIDELILFGVFMKELLQDSWRSDISTPEDDEMYLENLTLQFINLYGLIIQIINNRDFNRRFDIEKITELYTLSEYGYTICFRRLSQINPLNRIFAEVFVMADIYESDSPIDTSIDSILSTIKDISDIILGPIGRKA